MAAAPRPVIDSKNFLRRDGPPARYAVLGVEESCLRSSQFPVGRRVCTGFPAQRVADGEQGVTMSAGCGVRSERATAG